jgi:benzylsuccinate CoA-transferase BbsF subunit
VSEERPAIGIAFPLLAPRYQLAPPLVYAPPAISNTVRVNDMPGALSHLRICDFTGQLAGAGATKWLAAFGAQVIRIEDPANEGRWDILRGMPPYVDERRGVEFGGPFSNHNVGKLGITLNLRTDRGKELLRKLISISDAVTENFAAGVLDRWGFTYDVMREIRPDIIYVSNCGFGHVGPYGRFKTWGPIVQAVSGLTFSSGLKDQPPAGWGYSYMDHTGAYYMAIAIMAAIRQRNATGLGQHVDLACVEAGATLNGPAMLDYTINGRPVRREGSPDANRSDYPAMAPHGIYPSAGDDNWVAIACRNDADWQALARIIGERWATEPGFDSLTGRKGAEDDLDRQVATWTASRTREEVVSALLAVGVPVGSVQRPQERIDEDPDTASWGLWPSVNHTAMGRVRVDGMPVHFSSTDWAYPKAAPCLGEDNDQVYTSILGLSTGEVAELRAEGVI